MQNHALVQPAPHARPSGLLDTASKIDAAARSHVTGSLRFALGTQPRWCDGAAMRSEPYRPVSKSFDVSRGVK